MGLVFFLTGTEDPAERRETDPAAADSLLTLHDQVVGTAISDFGGRVARSLPEGVFAVFPPDADWPGCAIEIQKRVCSPDTMPDGPLPVRIAIHAGSALERGGEIFGRVVDRARRILDTASAGQIVLSREAAELCSVPEGASLRDLGVQRLKDLGEPERLYDLIGPDTPVTDFPPICTLADLPNNLPTQLTPFIGRTEELTKLTDLLADPGKKLVTLVGRGGSGKSRLALQAAAEASDDFPDGVWFVPLETSENTDQMVGAIADSIGYAFRSSDMVNELLEHIGRWATLIVLDSYDHLTTLSAGVPREILMGASRAKILITSRERLRVRGEQVVEVGGMQFTDSGTLEDMKSDAVRLFLETASKVTADPMDSPAEVSAIVGVCSALRGLPLAIELTSSWTRHMGIKEILSKITEPGFLRGEAATEPHGQAGISAVLDYSWRFLPEDEKIAFESVSVFRGMFDKLAAKAVADARFGQLVALVDKSLVQQTGTGRFVMHPLVRQHGRTKLEAHPQRRLEVERRHSEYYLGLLAAREPELLQGERSTAVIGLERELQNIELAWTSAAERSDW
ncbi:adenylate/guanylate cyclase domain-containing protein, partial [Candidatus Fermentibacterales bacterium]|nr:adenylate/guanylate cyclase domain-containing protein [Candidatus Fermentibacterales bacterium]